MHRHMFKFVASPVRERFSSTLGCSNDRISDENFASVSDFTAVLPTDIDQLFRVYHVAKTQRCHVANSVNIILFALLVTV